jgi:hypothetical protein
VVCLLRLWVSCGTDRECGCIEAGVQSSSAGRGLNGGGSGSSSNARSHGTVDPICRGRLPSVQIPMHAPYEKTPTPRTQDNYSWSPQNTQKVVGGCCMGLVVWVAMGSTTMVVSLSSVKY